jgi:hypothetical protein
MVVAEAALLPILLHLMVDLVAVLREMGLRG